MTAHGSGALVPPAVNTRIYQTHWGVTGTHESNNFGNRYFILR